MTRKIPDTVSDYMRRIGRRGGKAGAGKPKKRPPGYYSEIARRPRKKVDSKSG